MRPVSSLWRNYVMPPRRQLLHALTFASNILTSWLAQFSYKFDTPFEREIKEEVFKIVRRGKEFGTFGWHFRAYCYIALFFGLQYLWVTTETSILLAVVYGVSQAFIGLNVQHDANHGAASRTPWVNNLLGLGADFIGGSKWLWFQQHWTVSAVFRSRLRFRLHGKMFTQDKWLLSSLFPNLKKCVLFWSF